MHARINERQTISGIYLEKKFRNRLFGQAYKNSGESLSGLALAVGYYGKGRNGYVRNMWLGKVPVSSRKIDRIARLAGIPVQEVFEHRVDKKHNLEIDDWLKAFRCFNNQQTDEDELPLKTLWRFPI